MYPFVVSDELGTKKSMHHGAWLTMLNSCILIDCFRLLMTLVSSRSTTQQGQDRSYSQSDQTSADHSCLRTLDRQALAPFPPTSFILIRIPTDTTPQRGTDRRYFSNAFLSLTSTTQSRPFSRLGLDCIDKKQAPTRRRSQKESRSSLKVEDLLPIPN